MIAEIHLNALRQFLTNIHPIDTEAMEALLAGWQMLPVQKRQVITAAGEVERYMYFVAEGVQRVYYLSERSQEFTLVFTYPPSLGGVADSFLMQQPSRYFYEALSNGLLLRLPFSRLEQLMVSHRAVETLIRKATNMAMAGLMAREVELVCYSAEEKFQTLMRRSPHLLQMVPHKILASYLNIDPTNFSKLMGRIKI